MLCPTARHGVGVVCVLQFYPERSILPVLYFVINLSLLRLKVLDTSYCVSELHFNP